MLLVRELRSPSFSMVVLVCDLLQVPPSCALALAWSCSLLGFSLILLLVVALPPSLVAALPPPPMVEEVPAGPVEAPPSPKVEAEVPPAAPLPAVPTVPLPPLEDPAPALEALWAKARGEAAAKISAATIRGRGFIGCSPLVDDRRCSCRSNR